MVTLSGQLCNKKHCASRGPTLAPPFAILSPPYWDPAREGVAALTPPPRVTSGKIPTGLVKTHSS